jgi:dTDP-L-rhamnose 4-epimerase
LGQRYGVPTVALRYSIVQGPRQSIRNAYSGALRSFAVRVLTGQPPVLYEDGEQLRDHISIHDVVRANLLVLTDTRAGYQVINVGAARRLSVRQLAEMVIREAGSTHETNVPGLFRVGDTRHILSDVSRLGALGWKSQVSQPEMVREYLAWAAEQPDLQDTFAPAQTRMQALGVVRSLAPAGS